MATWTPWGPSQGSDKIAPGITFYSTASHGGIKLSEGRQQQMPEALRLEKPWYEEDCEVARVVLAFPDHFSDKQLEAAQSTLKDYYPQAYEQFYGVELEEGESKARDKALYHDRHEHDLLAVSAISIGDLHVKVSATPGGDRSYIHADKKQEFVVPKEEYDAHMKAHKAHCPFVVDPSRHESYELFEKRMLESQRRAVADELYTSYDFGREVIDANGWEKEGETYSRRVFFEDDHDGDQPSTKGGFTVVFEEGETSVLEAYGVDNKGNILGDGLDELDSPGMR